GRGRQGRAAGPTGAGQAAAPPSPSSPSSPGASGAPGDDSGADDLAPRITLLVESRAGYRNLCRLLSAAATGRMKGEARASWELIAEHSAGLHCLTGGMEGPLARALRSGGMEAARKTMGRMAAIFP